METFAKMIKAIFFAGDDPDKTAVQKLKDFLLTVYIILTLLGVGLYMWTDEDDQVDASTELIDE